MNMMRTHTSQIRLSTRGHGDVIDITTDVSEVVRKLEISNGVAVVFCPSSTSAITTIEYESGCVRDLQRLFDDIVDPYREYAHNTRWGDGNGHAHVRAALLGPSLSIPIVDGRLTLGTWQQIVYVDFDNRERRRELIVQVMGY
jgi:secondary thiamine-phosphate synthase enzyme